MPTRTELIWDGKYDENGKRVAPLRVALPFQTVETVNESAKDRQLNLFQAASKARPWRNRLIWGDKKYVLPSLLSEFAGKVDLIYIDPPFDTGADFSFTANVPESGQQNGSFTKQPSIIEQKAYRDTWGRGLDSYLQWFGDTLVFLHELLSENGSLYVHLDPRSVHHVKLILDELFGSDRSVSEVIWKRTHAHGSSRGYGPVSDSILLYAKSDSYIWNYPKGTHDDAYVKGKFTYSDEGSDRLFQPITLTGDGIRTGESGKPWRGFNPTSIGRHWALPGAVLKELGIEGGTLQDRLDALDDAKMIYWPKKEGGSPRLKHYLDQTTGPTLGNVWTDIDPVNSQAKERLAYPTQKPEALLERIMKASSNEGGLVLDCFVGSGTTAAVAEKLNRRWIACDLGRFAIHTTRKRLLSIPDVRPFVVQNLGKYERQAWQVGAFDPGQDAADQAVKQQQAYIRFILDLYHATPLHGYSWLHGLKKGRMVHVGSVDAPVSAGDVTQIAAEFKRAVGTGNDAPTTNGVDVLGWDFAFEINEVARQQAGAANIRMQFKRIPRDVMDKRAVEQGEIHFFELAALGIDVKTSGLTATLKLTEFVIPPDDVPEDVRVAVKHWSQWIDYWSMDWDNKSDAFHNEWQTFRTRKEPQIELAATHAYSEPGEYRVAVKVIAILGNDTTKTLMLKVKK
jgi:DNA modification methylase